MIAAGCAGIVTVGEAAGEAAVAGGENPGEAETDFFDPAGPKIQMAIARADRLVASLGSDQVAVEALFWAFDRG